MNIKALIFNITLVMLSLCSYSQSYKLKGKVMNQKNETLEGATLLIQGTENSTKSNEKGKFEFKHLNQTKFKILISHIGYSVKEVNVNLKEEDEIKVVLSATSQELQGVEILGRKESSYKNTNSFTATKTETKLRDVPQAVSYVTKEVIDDQMAFKVADVLKNISGVSQNSYTNNKYILRGFESESKQSVVNGLKTFSGERNADVLPYVERIEVIKGPASALFANASPGGTVNTITKKPLQENRKSINFSAGSFNTTRVMSDFTGPMNDSKTFLYRLNLAYQNAGSFRDLQNKETFVVAPSISFIPNDKTSVNFDLVYINDKGKNDRGQPIFAESAETADIYSTPISLAITRANDYVKSTKLISTVSLHRKITDYISFNASYLKGVYKEDMQEHRTANRNGLDAAGKSIPNMIEMQLNYRLTENYSDNLTSYFIFDFNTGPVLHKLLLGYDYIQNADGFGNTTYSAGGYKAKDGVTSISKYDPKKKGDYLLDKNGNPVPNVPFFNTANPDYSISERSSYIDFKAKQEKMGKYYTQGIYVQDQIKWNKFQALIALRQEFYTDIEGYGTKESKKVNQKALLPRFGLVYTPFVQTSFYGTYTYGYQPQNAGTIGNPEVFGGPFDPLISNMVEFGTKTEWIKDRLAVNVAVYRIEQNNILETANDPDNVNLLRQIGQQLSRGLEVDIYGQILHNLSITANLALNKNIISKSDLVDEIGKQASNAPRSQGGIWAKYTFIDKTFHGLGIAIGSNFQSSKLSKGKKNEGVFKLPAYTLANAAVYYTVDKFKLSATFNNIFDKRYWIGADSFSRLFPGAPKNYLFGIGYTF